MLTCANHKQSVFVCEFVWLSNTGQTKTNDSIGENTRTRAYGVRYFSLKTLAQSSRLLSSAHKFKTKKKKHRQTPHQTGNDEILIGGVKIDRSRPEWRLRRRFATTTTSSDYKFGSCTQMNRQHRPTRRSCWRRASVVRINL